MDNNEHGTDLISRAQAIDAIEAEKIKHGNYLTSSYVGYEMAEKVVKQLQPIQPEPHWIPCSEGLPKEEGFYLVTLEYKCGAETTIRFRFFRIENGERHWSLWGNETITAWMPQPIPYQAKMEVYHE